MTNPSLKKRLSAVLLVTVLVLAAAALLSACGGSSSSSSSSTSESGSTTSEKSENPESSEESEGSGGESGVSKAEALIAPLIGHPSAFPVTEKLKERPTGATFAYMDCGAPFCAFFYELLQPAAKAMGVKLERIKAGSAANTVSAAFETVVQQKPAAVIVTANPKDLWARQLKELQEEGVKVVTTGVSELEGEEGVAPFASEVLDEELGQVTAAYVAANFGTESNVVYYNIPELPFTAGISESFKTAQPEVCPRCKLRETPIPIATLGNTAPQTIVSDLQANPETTVAMFPSSDMVSGLPSALKTAGISVKTLQVAPSPPELQYLKEGKLNAGIAADVNVLAWTMMDSAARLIAGQELSQSESEGQEVLQFLTKEDITFDPAKGWVGYPDYVEKFEKLWGLG